MSDGQKKNDPGDVFRDSMRAVTGVIGAFKDAIEQTFTELSDRGDIAPDRARDAARDAMKRAQEAMDEMRDRVDFVSRRDFDALKAEVAELRAQVERHASSGAHHTHGAAGSGEGTGSPGV